MPLKYVPGFHTAKPFVSDSSTAEIPIDQSLMLVHMKAADKSLCLGREQHKHEASVNMHADERAIGWGMHFSTKFDEGLATGTVCTGLPAESDPIKIPEQFKSVAV